MSVTVAYTVEIGDVASPDDLTSRCIGFSVDQHLDFMRPSSQTCVMTFNNHDGAMLPSEAGGSGTYSAVDWMSSAVMISATVNGTETAVIFHGVIDDFQIADDGRNSTVTLSAVDAMSVIGRSPTVFPGGLGGNDSPRRSFETFIQGMSSYSPNALPEFGGSNPSVSIKALTETDYGPMIATASALIRATEPATIADGLAQHVMPSALSIGWFARIVDVAGSTEFQINYVACDLYRTDSAANIFEFVEGSPSANQINFSELDVGYLADRRVNWARITSTAIVDVNPPISTETAEGISSQSVVDYGAQSFTAGEAVNYRFNPFTEQAPSPEAPRPGMQQHAEQIANIFSAVRWTPRSLSTSTSMFGNLDSSSADDVALLLDNTGGLWNRAKITYTMSGGASTTSDCVIVGRRINATPEDTSIRLSFMPTLDMQPFVLGDTDLGVLGQNRLGI